MAWDNNRFEVTSEALINLGEALKDGVDPGDADEALAFITALTSDIRALPEGKFKEYMINLGTTTAEKASRKYMPIE